MPKNTLFMIGGPTASGKTAAALELAARVDGCIINADAMQVYAGLPLLTAQPTAEEKSAAPHKLFEIFDPAEKSSVGRWRALALRAITEAVEAGQTPVLVGGTGLYFMALLGGLAYIPPVPADVHDEADALYERLGHEAFRAALADLDPASATRIAPNDRQRLVRAYEVATHTGRTLGAWQETGKAESIEKDFVVERRLLMPERAALYAACDARFLKMMECGALEEARGLAGRRLDPALPSMKILGAPELMAHLRGELSFDEAIAKAQQATRNYAKRQMTWFRNQWSDS